MSFNQKGVHRKLTSVLCLVFAFLMFFTFSQDAFAAQDSTSLPLSVEQIFVKPASSTNVNGVFTYKLTALHPSFPMPEGSNSDGYSFNIDGNNKVDLEPIVFTKVGEYTYELKLDSSIEYLSAYKCDDVVYTIKVLVKRNDDGFFTEHAITSSATKDKVDNMSFQHSYKPLPTDLTADTPIRKTVSGTPASASTFIFKLAAASEEYPMPEGSVNGVKAVTIVGAGEDSFGSWSYTDEGTYTYTVTEVNSGESRYTYDSVVYTITDVVTDDKGQLVCSRTLKNSDGNDVDSYDFVNKFDDTPDPTTPTLSTVPSNPANPDVPANITPVGPKTGDDLSTTKFFVLIAVFGVVAIGCAVYLFTNKRKV